MNICDVIKTHSLTLKNKIMKKSIPVFAFVAICSMLFSCSRQTVPPHQIIWTGITQKGIYAQDELPGNAPEYSLDSLVTLKKSPLQGKTIFWLGSSITFGLTAHGEATADMLAKHNGAVCYKEAASGTTIANIPATEEMAAILTQIIGADPSKEDLSFTARIHDLPLDVKPDLFVLQLSTNDSRLPAESIGAIGKGFDTADFDLATTLGGMEYIMAYVRNNWHCPVLIYTSPFLSDDQQYKAMLDNAYRIADKWGAYILDMTADTAFNAEGRKNFDLYMAPDGIHPTRAGYQLWWLPRFEKRITEILTKK